MAQTTLRCFRTENVSLIDGNLNCVALRNNTHDAAVLQLVLEGILSPVTAFLGLFGNIASIIVLSRPDFQDTFYQLLHSLSYLDLLFLCEYLCFKVYDMFEP